MSEQRKEKTKKVSRREFIAAAGGFALGTVVGSGKLDLLTGAKAEGPLFPWKWKVIDPEPVAQKAADYYVSKVEYDKLQHGGKFAGFNCTEAAFAALTEAQGVPVTKAMQTQGGGGVAGWQCICGALAGSLDAISIYHGREVRGDKSTEAQPVRHLMDWFTKTAGAPCCHVSVTTRARNEGWAGKNWGCPDHLYSCALLTGRVVEKTVELLNLAAEGKLQPYKVPEVGGSCKVCHQPMTGVSDCTACHDKQGYTQVPHKPAPIAEAVRNPKQPNYLKLEKGYLNVK
jgi:C_GCAxxG_C_C family probable redox protein